MLTRQVEVELLESEFLLANNELASIGGDDLNSGAQVLELGALRHVRDLQRDVGGRHQVEDSFSHIDRRLSGTSGTEAVGTGVERRPVQGALQEEWLVCVFLHQAGVDQGLWHHTMVPV